jgi:hypothetical protein
MTTAKEQLQALRSVPENWDGYGAAAPLANVVDLADEFVAFIDAVLRKSASGPGSLQASPTRVGGVLIEWEDGTMEHEVEINPDGSMGFLHTNKTTGQIAARKISPGSLQMDFLKELHQLVAA